MPDIFLSYSSRDREVAERVEAMLVDEGYDVFWDQSTPPGVDWDDWIRRQLRESACVLVLWSKASVASPNVKHEAIIAREKGKLLPAMIDLLEPNDFPMGLFLVQALNIGRTRRSLEKAWPKLLSEVKAKMAAHEAAAEAEETAKPDQPGHGVSGHGTAGHGTAGHGMPGRRPGRRRRRRWAMIGGGAVVALLMIAAILHFGDLTIFLNPGAPPVSAEQVQAAVANEALARDRVVRSADEALSSGREAIGTSWVWLASQMVSAAPEQARTIAPSYFQYLGRGLRADCGCWYAQDIQHAVGNAWVIIAFSRYRQPLPPALVRTVLTAQSPEGWWSIALNSTRDASNGAMHATGMMTIALVQARDAGVIPADQRPAADAAIARAVTWLNRGPEDGNAWSDYPGNDRRIENLVFSAVATVATRVAGQEDGRAMQAFIRSAEALPGALDSFPSNTYVTLNGGERFVDQYRHPQSPWVGAAAIMAYPQASIMERRRLRRIVRSWLELDISDERLLRQDWLTGETLFLRSLSFPMLAEGQ